MTTAAPAAPVKAAPVVGKPATPPVVDPKAAPVVPATEVKEIDPLEKGVAEKWGDDWTKASPKAKERALEAERKVRESDKRFPALGCISFL